MLDRSEYFEKPDALLAAALENIGGGDNFFSMPALTCAANRSTRPHVNSNSSPIPLIAYALVQSSIRMAGRSSNRPLRNDPASAFIDSSNEKYLIQATAIGESFSRRHDE